MASKLDFTKTIFIVITGASQGIGRTIAIEIASHLKSSSKILLLARSESGLLETKKLVNEANENVNVAIYPIDLSKLDVEDYADLLNKEMKGHAYDNAMIVHNAGQVGALNKTTETKDLNIWRNYYDLNLFSVVALNAAFFKIFNATKLIYVINVTSLCGRLPYKNMSMYGSGKAARELFFKVLAIEEINAIVLNYSPGPVKTAMHTDIITNAKDEELREMFLSMDKTLTCEQTVNRLIGILEKGDFISGDTIDYFDKV